MTLTRSGSNVPTFPDTPAGEKAAFVASFLLTPVEEISFEAFDGLYHPDQIERWPRPDDDARRQRWNPAQEAADVESISPHVAAFTVGYTPKHRWRITVRVEETPPHRIVDENWRQLFDMDIVIREAELADAPALSELDRIAPIQQGDVKVSFDRGDDYFADARLIEHAIVAVGEIDGTVVGVNWGAVHSPIIAGTEYTLATALHLRVHPDHQGKGVWSAINSKLWEFFNSFRVRTSYAFVHRDNQAIQKDFSKNATRWSVPVFRALIGCAAGAVAGRTATPDDAPRIVEVLNGAHAGEEMYVPYTTESLTARLERAPDLYTWDNVLIDGDAVLGVWPAGLRVFREENDERTESVRAFALDYGFLPGAEQPFENVVRGACARLSEIGTTELALFTWEGAPSYPIAAALGATFETFDLFTFGIPEPDGTAERGLYVDQIYI
jgi:GNAT superfamily N-acetyltransferase